MRLTIQLLGHTLDLSLEATAPDEAAPTDLGYVTATPVGFVSTHEMPDECPLPMRNNRWGDEE